MSEQNDLHMEGPPGGGVWAGEGNGYLRVPDNVYTEKCVLMTARGSWKLPQGQEPLGRDLE